MTPEFFEPVLERELPLKDFTLKEELGIRAGMRLIPGHDQLASTYNDAILILTQNLYHYTGVPFELVKSRLASARITAKPKFNRVFVDLAPNFLPIAQEQIDSISHDRLRSVLTDANRVEECFGKSVEELFYHPKTPKVIKSEEHEDENNVPVKVLWLEILEEHIYFLYRRMTEHRRMFEECEAIPKSWQERYYDQLKPKYEASAARLESRKILGRIMRQLLRSNFKTAGELDDDKRTLIIVSHLLGSAKEIDDFLKGTF